MSVEVGMLVLLGLRFTGSNPLQPDALVKIVSIETYNKVMSYAYGTFFTGLEACPAIMKCNSPDKALAYINANDMTLKYLYCGPSF